MDELGLDMADQQEQQAMRVDSALVRELAELLSANELTEIEVEDGDRKVRVRRDAAPMLAYAPAPAIAATHAPAAAASAAEAAPAAAVDAVKSPMVGTAYLSPEPGAKPFIAVGTPVKLGDTLLIIEAMKVMNTITAPRAGTVTQICIADGQPVEFDQILVLLD